MTLTIIQAVTPFVLCLTGISLVFSILIVIPLKNDIRNWVNRVMGQGKSKSLKPKSSDQLLFSRYSITKVRGDTRESRAASTVLLFIYSLLFSIIGVLFLSSRWIWLTIIIPIYFAILLFLVFEDDIALFLRRLILPNEKKPKKKTKKIIRGNTLEIPANRIASDLDTSKTTEYARKKIVSKKRAYKRLLPHWLIYILFIFAVIILELLIVAISATSHPSTPFSFLPTQTSIASNSITTTETPTFAKNTATHLIPTAGSVSPKTPYITLAITTPSGTKTTSFTATALPTSSSNIIISSTPPAPLQITPSSPDIVIQLYEEVRTDARLWVLRIFMGLFATYLIGVIALIFGAWKSGSVMFSRSLLSNLASKPLLITPKFASWALFLGYKQRLLNQLDVDQIRDDFFGLPAIDPQGNFVNYDNDGNQLNNLIANALGYQKPVIVTAPGGGGKTTLLERWIYLAVHQKLPDFFHTYTPIFVTPAYYSGDTLDAIVGVLKERDGVAITRETAQAQLETGKYLILFDGVSEIDGDKNLGLKDILRFAQNAEFRFARFVISTRPGLNLPPEVAVFQLQPLTTDVVRRLFQKFGLNSEQQLQINRQLQLFGSKPIEPLLFTMILAQGEDSKAIYTKAQLYEKYFKRLLRVENEKQWRGWDAALQEIARWSMLDTGSRGLGLLHESLVERMFEKQGSDELEFIKRLNKIHKLKLIDELDLLERLESAGILNESRRWRFVHDTFEEYFSAGYIVSNLIRRQTFPDLSLWNYDESQIQSFMTVIEFVCEMIDDGMTKVVRNLRIPDAWKNILMSRNTD